MEFVWTLAGPMSEWVEPPGVAESQKLGLDNRQLQLATLARIHAISAHPAKPPVALTAACHRTGRGEHCAGGETGSFSTEACGTHSAAQTAFSSSAMPDAASSGALNFQQIPSLRCLGAC